LLFIAFFCENPVPKPSKATCFRHATPRERSNLTTIHELLHIMSKSVTLLPSTRPFPAIDFEYSIHKPNTRLLQELRRIFPDVDASMNVVLLFQRSSEDMSAYCRESVLEKDRLFQNVSLIYDNTQVPRSACSLTAL
jgi:hypothetical protein